MKRGLIVFAVAMVLIGGGAYWLSRPEPARAIPSSPPAGAPAAGSCWTVDVAGMGQALPWSTPAVDCAAAHTVELFAAGQVDAGSLHRLDQARSGRAKNGGGKNGQAESDDIKVAENLLYAEARRSCVLQASIFLGGGWHSGRVRVVASWIAPAKDGFYGCGLAEVGGPAGVPLLPRQGSLKSALSAGDDAPLSIGCVARGADGDLTYVPCGSRHDGEFVGVYTITPMDAPFDEKAVRSASDRGCGEVALKYLGLTADASRTDLRAAGVGPKSATEWLGSDQTFGCYVMSDKPLKATVKALGAGPLPVA